MEDVIEYVSSVPPSSLCLYQDSAIQEAQKDGTFAGVTAGLLGGSFITQLRVPTPASDTMNRSPFFRCYHRPVIHSRCMYGVVYPGVCPQPCWARADSVSTGIRVYSQALVSTIRWMRRLEFS
jgi:hypothetical protein